MRKVYLTLSALFSLIAFSARADIAGQQFTSLLGFTLEGEADDLSKQTTLSDIEAAFGKTPLIISGDAGEYDARLCYKSKNGYVQFSSGEMGGREHVLEGFEITKLAPHITCSDFPEKFSEKNLSLGGIKLGMTRKDFMALTGGKVESDRPDTVSAFFDSKQPMSEEEKKRILTSDLQTNGTPQQDYLDVDISIEGKFSNAGRLESFSVNKITSY